VLIPQAVNAGEVGLFGFCRGLDTEKTMSGRIRVVNLEEGFPTRDQACQKLEAALARARKDGVAVLKVIHGYGSSGAGGVLRFAIRGFLRQRKDKGEIAAFVNGESWSSFDERSKLLFAKAPELILDSDVGRGNKGITLVLL
jgi:Smr domain